MPADGISLPQQKGTSARPAGRLEVRLHQRRHPAEGAWPLGARSCRSRMFALRFYRVI